MDSKRQLEDALVKLKTELENFLILNIIKKEENRKLLLLEVYREKRLSKRFHEQLANLKNKKATTFLDFWRKIPVAYKAYYNDVKSRAEKDITSLQDTLEEIHQLKTLTQLKFACEALSRELVGLKDQNTHLISNELVNMPLNDDLLKLISSIISF
ncbi:MAG: hypothetical protein HC912_05780 [Saprospiraceae bacterium]|nr:hypothetical protein [Saprospiraceae bacterium]